MTIHQLSHSSLVRHWPIFYSFLIFSCYFTPLKAREISCRIFAILHSSLCDELYKKCYMYMISIWSSSKIWQIWIPARFQIFLNLKKKRKFDVKLPWCFHVMLLMWLIFVFNYTWQLWLAYKGYSKFSTKSCKKQCYVYWDYNDTSVIYNRILENTSKTVALSVCICNILLFHTINRNF